MKKAVFISLIVLSLVLPMMFYANQAVGAVTPPMQEGLDVFQTESGASTATLPTVIGKVVKIVISFLGLIAAVIIIIGGFQWMTSGGNEEKIAGAKKLMINGLIGMVLVILAYAIASFVISSLSKVTG